MAKEITFRNDSNFSMLQQIINNSMDEDDLIVRFEDDYYDMTELPFSIGIPVLSNISFIGNKNGTIFDYKNQKKGVINYSFNRNNLTLKIKNIIFENYNSEYFKNKENVLSIRSYIEDFHIVIENCTFRNNYSRLLYVSYSTTKLIELESQILLNKCNF